MQFKREIGFFGLLLTGIGSMLGSGWLFGSLYAAQAAGPAAIIAWILGGFLMSIIALTFAELGSAFPVAGGMVQYAQYSHGPLVSFMTGWMIWLSSMAVAPVETLGLIQYAANYIPGLVTKVANTTVLTHNGILLGAMVMLVMCALNYYGAKFFSRSAGLLTTLKLIMPVVTCLVLFSVDFNAANFHSPTAGGFIPMGWHGVLAALPLGGVIYAFIGSNTILQLAGETKNPQRNIPLALIGSILFCMVLYVALQTAFIGALPASSLVKGWQHVHYAGDSGPFAGILMTLGISWFVVFIYADAFISPFGTGFIFTAATARVGYGLSRIKLFPKGLQRLTRKGVPVRALILNYVVGLLLFLPFPSWKNLVSFIISCFIVSYIIGPIALIVLRKTQPEYPRPFKLPYPTLMTVMAFFICNLLVFWTGWAIVSRMMMAMVFGFLVFLVHCFYQKSNIWKAQWQSSWWIAPYIMGMCIISYLGSYGQGLSEIPFGIDFVVLAVFSLIIFYLAIRISERREHSPDGHEIMDIGA